VSPSYILSHSIRQLTSHYSYREKVERNQVKLSLTHTWPAILYDESMFDDDNEFSGLFRSETLLRVSSSFISVSTLFMLMRSKLSAESPSCAAHLQGANGSIPS
jgi:hypothetical protein